MSGYEIDLRACRGRQQRLAAEMQRLDLDLVIVNQAENIQWLSGARFGWTFQPAAALTVDGRCVLSAPNKPPASAAADDVVTYEAKRHSTLRNDQRQASSSALAGALDAGPKPRRVGVEFSSFDRHLAQLLGAEWLDVEPDLYVLRRCKDPDELALIRKAIAGTGRMYERAREIIRPGVNELEVFNQLQAAVVEEFGEMPTGVGNDFQCGSRGGPPRDRLAEAGELYILDLGPAFRGYFADNCRTIAVTQPSSEQQEAWARVIPIFEHVEKTVKPGASAQQLFHEAHTTLNAGSLGVFNHHLGHGIGLFPHEAPHLNPRWNDTIQVGEVFTVEPGLYAPELRAGLRIENNYVVTEDGVELLSDFPLQL
jgi:Xaa-Pro aminopeptidase